MLQFAKHIYALWDKNSNNRSLQCVVLVLFSLLIFLPGQSTIPPMDRDEPRFAQASRQMIETQDFVDIRFQDEARHKKPVGIYWVQSSIVTLAQKLGVPNAIQTIALYRIPSLLGAIALVLLTFWAGLAFMSHSHAFLAALLMASSVLLNVEARLAKTDALLSATIMATLAALAHIWVKLKSSENISFFPLPLIFWLSLSASILLKGPVGLMIVAFPVLATYFLLGQKNIFKALQPQWGLALLLACVSPWFIAIYIKSGGNFFAESIGKDLSQKLVSGKESHGAPPGLYALVFWATFWPGSILLLPMIKNIWQNRKIPQIVFLLSWGLPSWLIMEAIPTKLPHYVLPLYPAIALLIGYGLEHDWHKKNAFFQKYFPLLWPILLIILSLAALIGLYILEAQFSILASIILSWAIFEAFGAYTLYKNNQPKIAIISIAFASFLLMVGVLGILAPKLQTIWISSQLAASTKLASCPNPQLASAGFSEPSLVFLTQTDIKLTDGQGAAKNLIASPCAIVFVEQRQWQSFDTEIANANLKTQTLKYIKGININGGRKLNIAIIIKQGS